MWIPAKTSNSLRAISPAWFPGCRADVSRLRGWIPPLLLASSRRWHGTRQRLGPAPRAAPNNMAWTLGTAVPGKGTANPGACAGTGSRGRSTRAFPGVPLRWQSCGSLSGPQSRRRTQMTSDSACANLCWYLHPSILLIFQVLCGRQVFPEEQHDLVSDGLWGRAAERELRVPGSITNPASLKHCGMGARPREQRGCLSACLQYFFNSWSREDYIHCSTFPPQHKAVTILDVQLCLLSWALHCLYVCEFLGSGGGLCTVCFLYINWNIYFMKNVMQFYYWCELKIMNVSWSSSLWFVPQVAEACITCAWGWAECWK